MIFLFEIFNPLHTGSLVYLIIKIFPIYPNSKYLPKTPIKPIVKSWQKWQIFTIEVYGENF
jgi:hypothetical protein